MSTNIREFLLRVLPWPGDDTPGFCNVHVQCRFDGKTPWSGKPTRNVDDFLQEVYIYRSWPTPPDIYMCLSRQGKTKPGKNNKEGAAKHQADALALKAIWLDIDVKPKAFKTVSEALEEVKEFYTKYKLPLPSAYVASGGGLHVYWISNRELTPAEWQPYADGLKHLAIEFFGSKIDAGVIADSARVLRVPGTFNFKYDPPRPVKLLGLSDGDDYDFNLNLDMLRTMVPIGSMHINQPVLTGRPDTAFAKIPVESLGEGIGHDLISPLDPTEMVRQCGHFREALTTGGKDFSQGLWNLTTLASTFLENGHAYAHRMARGHAGYTYDETEALWERKVVERSSIGLGWPSCSSIQGEGCKHCATCPILARGKSPLNLARIPKPVVASPPVSSYVAPSQVGTQHLVSLTNVDMPDPTYTVIKDIVHKSIERREKGQPPSIEQIPLFHCRLYGPTWVQSHPEALNFVTSLSKGSYADVCLEKKQMTAMELERVLYDKGVLPIPENQKYVRSFIVSWLGKLQNAAAAHTNVPFGWHMDGNTCKGFSYGSVLYKSDGTRGPVGLVDPKLRAKYGPTGDIEPWWEAYRTIRNQERIGLQVIMASAFGAPLMFGAGQYSVLMSVFGDSGANKSSAARVAAAVWGSPKLTKENENATEKSVLQTLGQIKHLPYFWDEIKNEPAQKKAYNVLYMGTGGAEGSRLNSDVTQRDKGDWQTIVGIFSNTCFGNYVLKENPNTTAGLMRLFEWEEKEPSKNAPGMISTSDADRIFDKLDRNFGQIGKQYAAWLGVNRDLAYQTVASNGRWFEKAVDDPKRNTNSERFWIAFASAIQSGAEFANANIGTNFDIDAIRKFLVEKILAMRARSREENVQGGSADHTEQMLTGFLKYEEKATVVTKGAPPLRAGTPGIISIERPPQNGVAVQVQWISGLALELRFSKMEFYRWLGQPDVKGDIRAIMEGLKRHYAATVRRGTLAAGTSLAHGAEPLVFIPITTASSLVGMLPNDNTSIEGSMGGAMENNQPVGRDTELLLHNVDASRRFPGGVVQNKT